MEEAFEKWWDATFDVAHQDMWSVIFASAKWIRDAWCDAWKARDAEIACLRKELKASVELNNVREEQLRDELAQVARLREACEFALAKAKAEWDAVNRHPGSHHAEYVHVLSAALTDTADDWLERHDAEVREQERERCAGIADAEAETQRKVLAPQVSLETFAAMQSARAIAAAIREEE